MKKISCIIFILLIIAFPASGQDTLPPPAEISAEMPLPEDAANLHQIIKIKFIEGSALFMSVIALCLIIGLAFCLERIIYLNLAQIDTAKFLKDVQKHLNENNCTAAKETARNTRGPVASLCYQALSRIRETVDVIDKSITSYGSVQVGLLEKNLSWITLFIAIAPALGFLGTIIGMIQTFDNIQQFGDINPAIVSGGMKLALITTVGGLITALILQVFYNYILTKIEGIVNRMEDDSIRILDMIIQHKHRQEKNETTH
ncbi:MAG: MotA/TolQ/ExbB proton channel family protein [Candidatus Symbiothrix sp.]|jgi:biopolymer transport protein ExbB|nr:MotA/TolQ/ExbB proton channel family protein [Candidatus Symbiothrix sp.]